MIDAAISIVVWIVAIFVLVTVLRYVFKSVGFAIMLPIIVVIGFFRGSYLAWLAVVVMIYSSISGILQMSFVYGVVVWILSSMLIGVISEILRADSDYPGFIAAGLGRSRRLSELKAQHREIFLEAREGRRRANLRWRKKWWPLTVVMYSLLYLPDSDLLEIVERRAARLGYNSSELRRRLAELVFGQTKTAAPGDDTLVADDDSTTQAPRRSAS